MPQNAELEALIAKSPEDPGPYAVYADWLTEHGDPRGELITIALRLEHAEDDKLRARERELHAAHDAAWLGALAGQKDLSVTWRRGYIDELFIGDDEMSELGAGEMAELYAQARRLPVAALVSDLSFGAVNNEDGEPNWGATIEALVAHGAPASLRRLAFHRGSYWDVSWTYLGDLSPAYAQVPNLESLYISMGHMEFGDIVLPNLTDFEVYTGGFTKQNMASVLGAAWPKLERLTLRFGDQEDYGADCELADVLPLLDRRYPHLHHLGLGNAGFADELVPALAKSPLLRQLKTLDLSLGTLSDDGATALIQHADAFRHLEALDLRESFVSDEVAAAVKKVLPSADVNEQREGDEDGDTIYRYCVIGE